MLADQIKTLSDPEWRGAATGEVDYTIFDLVSPHCQQAIEYRDVRGTVRYRCRHTDKQDSAGTVYA